MSAPRLPRRARSATAVAADADASAHRTAFLARYNKIKDPDSGYFRYFGGPLSTHHSARPLLVEASDHGHETTSEVFSHHLWPAAHGRLEGDLASFDAAWASMEKFVIPAHAGQPANDRYDASKPATRAQKNPRAEFPSVRSFYRDDPPWPAIQSYLDG